MKEYARDRRRISMTGPWRILVSVTIVYFQRAMWWPDIAYLPARPRNSPAQTQMYVSMLMPL